MSQFQESGLPNTDWHVLAVAICITSDIPIMISSVTEKETES